jgi:predicted Fe-Mo cluster-binding NifX family protein
LKYAIPVSGGQLSSHFGQSEEFLLLDLDEGGHIRHQETLSVVPHSCGSLPGQMARLGVGVVLAGGMGMGPRLAFQSANIEVILGVSEPDPVKAAFAHHNHRLKSGANVCSHGDKVCDHGH